MPELPETPRPLFLERRSYRRRRLVDAARLLPFVAVALWLVPLLWPQAGDAAPMPTSRGIIYIFCVWAGLIVLAAILSRRVATGAETEPPAG